jgi:hypothetical protein
MEEGVLWRADVMEGPCAVARGEDTNTRVLFLVWYRLYFLVLVTGPTATITHIKKVGQYCTSIIPVQKRRPEGD